MAEIYLARHVHSSANAEGVLAGRTASVTLSKIGEAQRVQLARALAGIDFVAIYASPMERCIATALPIARNSKRRVRIAEDLNEMDYGAWSGRKLNSLRREPLWRSIQRRPASVTFPSGESFEKARRRVKRGLTAIAKRHRTGKVLVVTHGDIIKIAIQETLSGDLDKFQRIVVDPGSISVIDWEKKLVLSCNSSVTKVRKSRSQTSRTALGGGTNV